MGDDSSLLTPPEDPLLGKLLQDKYRVVRKIGEGGMGSVYEGEHTLINRRVAIKCLHGQLARNPEVVARFQREAMAANAIRHPNIVEVTDLGRLEQGDVFMVLEFLEGKEFAEAIEAVGAMRLGRVVHIISQVCDALSGAHEKGIVHRDLKPENIYLIERAGDPDYVKVLDFGIAKFREGLGDKITKTGTAMGTPYYMAPEQITGAGEVDHRADIYSLGVILYHALTGSFPFHEDSYPLLVMKICSSPAPPIRAVRSDLPVELEALIARMLEKDPAARPASCAELKATLAQWRDVDGAPQLKAAAIGFDKTAYSEPDANAASPTAAAGGIGPAPASQNDASEGAPLGADESRSAPTQKGAPVTGEGAQRPSGAVGTPSMHPPLPVPQKRSPALMAGIAAAVVGLCALGVAAATGAFSGDTVADPLTDDTETAEGPAGSADTGPSVAEGATVVQHPENTGDESVPVSIRTVPSDAVLLLDGEEVDNPYSGRLPRGSSPVEVEARHPRYRSRVEQLDVSVPQALILELERDRSGTRMDSSSMTMAMAQTGTTEETAGSEMATEMTTMEAVEPPTMMVEPSMTTEGGNIIFRPNLSGRRRFDVQMTD